MANKIEISAYDIAERFKGIKEVAGSIDNPQIMAMLRLDNRWPQNDETPWCSAFANYVAWLLGLSRSKDLRARSWINVGKPVELAEAEIGFDVVILQRGEGSQPGIDVISAPGHVGFYAGKNAKEIFLLGGNQGDGVSVAPFSIKKVLAVRRLV